MEDKLLVVVVVVVVGIEEVVNGSSNRSSHRRVAITGWRLQDGDVIRTDKWEKRIIQT